MTAKSRSPETIAMAVVVSGSHPSRGLPRSFCYGAFWDKLGLGSHKLSFPAARHRVGQLYVPPYPADSAADRWATYLYLLPSVER